MHPSIHIRHPNFHKKHINLFLVHPNPLVKGPTAIGSSPPIKIVLQYIPTTFNTFFFGQVPIGTWKMRVVTFVKPAARIISARYSVAL